MILKINSTRGHTGSLLVDIIMTSSDPAHLIGGQRYGYNTSGVKNSSKSEE